MKKTVAFLISIILIGCLSGCALVPSLDLTEREQKIIAEYAAGLLLKHDRNYSGALMETVEEEDIQILPEVEPTFVPEETPLDEGYEEQEFIDPEFSEELMAQDTSEDSNEPSYSDVPMSDVLGLDGFTVMYKNYEIHDIYPEAQSDDLVFSLQAQQGQKLVVMNFAITNDGAEKRLCDVLDSGVSFRVILNGEKLVNASTTILLNDLGSYYDEIEGYGMANAVVVCELPTEEAENIQTLDFKIKKDDQSHIYSLR